MIDSNGKIGYCVTDNTVFTFQIGEESIQDALSAPMAVRNRSYLPEGSLLQVDGYRVLTRGVNDMQISDVSRNIKNNRLLPEVIEKQVKIMFGEGMFLYKVAINDKGKLVRQWEMIDSVQAWLNSWTNIGLTEDYTDIAQAIIRRYYYFEDFFVKWRFAKSTLIGKPKVAGLELVENSKARLATDKEISAFLSDYEYDDFKYVAVGSWFGTGNFSVYPRFDYRDVSTYKIAISHHANDDVDNFYGRNKFYEGSRDWIEAANENPRFIRSFLRNSLAAKVHIVIPNEWVESKRNTIRQLCDSNRKRKTEGKDLYKFNGIDIGTDFNEAYVIENTNRELKKLTEFLSGSKNQGKAFSSTSFQNGKGEPVEWKINQIDLKYKEYIESLISFDRRSDEVLLSAKGIDPSISNVSKEGVISKSGSDAYYNYIIYQNQLSAPEKICCDPFNMALNINFPELYTAGYRLGFYRSVPERQQDITESNRITSQ